MSPRLARRAVFAAALALGPPSHAATDPAAPPPPPTATPAPPAATPPEPASPTAASSSPAPAPSPSPAAPPVAVRAPAGPPPPGCRPAPELARRAVSAESADRLRLSATTTRGRRPDEYTVRDGRVLLQRAPGEPGELFAPAALAARRRAEAEALAARGLAGEPLHPLAGLIDDADAFARDAPALADRMRARLREAGLEPDAPASIDTFSRRWSEARCRLDPALFRELAALAGQRAAAKADAAWSARPLDGTSAREPIITIGKGPLAKALAPWRWADDLLAGDGPTLDEAIERDRRAP